MRTKYGYMACPDCKERVVVKVNERGTLSYSCDECGAVDYRKKEVRAHWEKRITKVAPSESAAETGASGKGAKAAPKAKPDAPAAGKGIDL